MKLLKRAGIDAYMLILLATVLVGVVLPASGSAARILGHVTYWAVFLLFFLYGAKLDPAAIRAGFLNLRLQGLVLTATFVLFPVLGLILSAGLRPVLGPEMAMGLIFLAVLPSTVQSSIAFTSIAGGNVAAAICAASLSNILGVVLTPLLVARLIHLDGGGVSLAAIEKIGLQILLPFLLGQMLRRWIGPFVNRQKRVTTIVDRGAILLIVYAAFSAGTMSGLWSQIPTASLLLALAAVALFLALAVLSMIAISRLVRLPPADHPVLLFCGATKSLASGLPIAMALFPAATVSATILPLMIYHMTQLLLSSFLAQRLARSAPVAA